MTKAVLFCGMIFSSFVFGQFKLTPNNFVSEENPEKDYIVLEFPEQNQKQLFDKTKTFIHSNFINLKSDGLNEVQYSHIKARVNVGKTKISTIFGCAGIGNFHGTIELFFKNGKIMIKPFYEKVTFERNGFKKVTLTGGNFILKSIFNKKGEITGKCEHQDIEEMMNNFVKNLTKALNDKEDW